MLRKPKVSRVVLTMCAALFAAASSAKAESGDPSPGHPPEVTSVTCKDLKRIEVVNSNTSSITASTDYTDVPGAGLTFVTKRQGCVLVTFSAPVSAPKTFVLVQIVLSALTCLPSGGSSANIFAGQSTGNEYADSMTYLCPDVFPGKHLIRAQWKSTNGVSSGLDGFTMTVAHR